MECSRRDADGATMLLSQFQRNGHLRVLLLFYAVHRYLLSHDRFSISSSSCLNRPFKITAKEHMCAQQDAQGTRQWHQEGQEVQVRVNTRHGP